MEKYLTVFTSILEVLGNYLLFYVLLSFNRNFQDIKSSKKLYIVKNVVKSFVLLYVSIIATSDLYAYFLTNQINMERIYYYASIYVANDILALLIVPNLPQTTKIHHQITTLFLVYTLHIDYNDITNVGQLLFIYTIFSSYTFLVNFYLGIRFLKDKKNNYLNEIIEYSRVSAYVIYKYSCVINWTIHIILLSYRLYLGIYNLHYIIYSILLYFIIKDDLILMSWLKHG
jgi:hypothetical protein